MRLFVAVRPNVAATEHLNDFLDVRRDAADFRWTPAEHFHVTLAFLGDVADFHTDELIERLDSIAGRRTPFETRLAGGGAFPHAAAAKVLWTGLELEKSAREQLDQLSASARAAGSQVGARVDGTTFRPHVTVARLGRPRDAVKWARLLDTYAGPTWQVDELELVASHLGEGPRGRPRHEVLAASPLGVQPEH
jgi:RNA 2',3'-cyclic 3'-phosphodiesterase